MKTKKQPRFIEHPITITIAGPPKCGKSILSLYIEKSLKEAGFSVNVDDPEMTRVVIRYRQKNLLELIRNLVRLDRAQIVIRSVRKGRSKII